MSKVQEHYIYLEKLNSRVRESAWASRGKTAAENPRIDGKLRNQGCFHFSTRFPASTKPGGNITRGSRIRWSFKIALSQYPPPWPEEVSNGGGNFVIQFGNLEFFIVRFRRETRARSSIWSGRNDRLRSRTALVTPTLAGKTGKMSSLFRLANIWRVHFGGAAGPSECPVFDGLSVTTIFPETPRQWWTLANGGGSYLESMETDCCGREESELWGNLSLIPSATRSSYFIRAFYQCLFHWCSIIGMNFRHRN